MRIFSRESKMQGTQNGSCQTVVCRRREILSRHTGISLRLSHCFDLPQDARFHSCTVVMSPAIHMLLVGRQGNLDHQKLSFPREAHHRSEEHTSELQSLRH